MVLSAPQMLFHDHSDHDHHEYEDHNVLSFNGDDCFACDFDFTCFTAPVTVAKEITFEKGNLAIESFVSNGKTQESVIRFQRGPPRLV